MTDAMWTIIWRILAWILATIGCCYQVYHVSALYFDYETVNQVILNQSDYVTPPKIIFCGTPLWYTGSAEFWKTYANLSVAEKLNRSVSTDSIVRNVNFRKNTYEWDYISGDSIHVSRHVKNMEFQCYSIWLPGSLQVDMKARSVHIGQPAYLTYTVAYLLSVSSPYIAIFTHPSTLSFFGNSENMLLVSAYRNSSDSFNIRLTFTYYRSELMTYPHKTNCLNYNLLNKESRAHAFQDCRDKEFFEKFKVLPRDSLLADDVTDLTMDFPTFMSQNVTNELLLIEGECESKTRWPDCKTELYIPKSTSVLEAEYPYGMISVEPPGDPQIVTKSKAVIETIDFVTYVLSCISFWFGFSPLLVLTQGSAFKWMSKKIKVCKHEQDTDNTLNGSWKNYREELIEVRGELESVKKALAIHISKTSSEQA